MKKNLNIAYLNGAEGIRRCSASSDGSSGGSGSGSSDGKWEYYKIERSNISYDDSAMSNVFGYVTLVNARISGEVYIIPRGPSWSTTAAIAGISVKNIASELVIDTGSWLTNIKECDKLFGHNYDYSFLKLITEEEFYGHNFDYPV